MGKLEVVSVAAIVFIALQHVLVNVSLPSVSQDQSGSSSFVEQAKSRRQKKPAPTIRQPPFGANPNTGRSDYRISEDNAFKGGFLWPLKKNEDKTNAFENTKLIQMYSYLKKNRSSRAEYGKHLDSLPFPPRMISKHIKFPIERLEQAGLQLPDVPPAPTGMQAYDLAEKFGYPRHWRARQRPQFFLLGPPKTGTTFLDACIRWSMHGNSDMKPYPTATARWPQDRGPGGEPVYADSAEMLPFRIWNRTGFRRFDPPKEWWAYPEMGRYSDTIRGVINVLRFPPVEPESQKWVLIDSTPDSLMVPKSAQALHADIEGAPFNPTFLVTHRNAFDRAYSHYLLFSQLRTDWGWGPEKLRVFADRLDQQHQVLMGIPICKSLLETPEDVLKSHELTYKALRWCMYDPERRNQVMYLPFGFTALGLNYWLMKFPVSSFRLLRMADLKKLNSIEKLLTFSEATFSGFKRVKPRCEDPADWNSGNCTGHMLHDKAMLFCSSESPALKDQAWTDRKGLNISLGPDERLQKYRDIAQRWTDIFERFAEEKGLSFYDPDEEKYKKKV
eukprot:TRINITY_DN7021_c0_g1_i1.p1 TRINITY_DN7021_c0_g1~~TRINITY_DN7021_c0_g1_i1.p1  ORF type:complete len:558 (+),score=80.14 TRINITY_DN7021_c0_g1_i1:73-1746(+)